MAKRVLGRARKSSIWWNPMNVWDWNSHGNAFLHSDSEFLPARKAPNQNWHPWGTCASFCSSLRTSSSGRTVEGSKKSKVAIWGNGDFGRLGLGNEESVNVPSLCCVDDGDDDVEITHVACGGAHTIIATGDGRLFSMGLNDHGQLGNPKTIVYSKYPIEIEKENHKIKYLCAGHYHSGYISAEGDLYVWGNNSNGQLGIAKDEKNVPIPTKVTFFKEEKISQAAFGAEHSLAITESGKLYSWGKKAHGRLGLGPNSIFQNFAGYTSETVPKLVDAFGGLKIKKIAAGHLHSAVVDEYGHVFTFGYGRFGQTGMGNDENLYVPKQIPNLNQIVSIACGGSHTIAVNENGDLFSWGGNEHGCLGLGHADYSDNGIPHQIKNKIKTHTITDIACGWKHSAAISADGKLFTWGWGGAQGSFTIENHSSGGQLGLGNEFDHPEPSLVQKGVLDSGLSYIPTRAIQVSCGFNHTAAIVR